MRLLAHHNSSTLSRLRVKSQWCTHALHQSGAGMIEVLISIVIVAFALLGMAGLQVASLRYQKVAHFRGLAAQYETEIAERIRSNVAGAQAGNYIATAAYNTALPCGAFAPPAAATEAAVAARDIAEWRAHLACGLAGGWGEITGNMAANGYLRVTVYFREPNKNDNRNNVLDPNCRAGALAAGDTDVRCFKSVVAP